MTLRRSGRISLTVGFALSTTGCYTMRPVTFEQLGASRPGAVWITRSDQSEVILETPRVFGDTLVGYINGEFQELSTAELNPQLYRVRQMAGLRTAALVAVTAVGAGTFVSLVSGNGLFFDKQINLDCEDDPEQPGCPGAPPGS